MTKSINGPIKTAIEPQLASCLGPSTGEMSAISYT